MKKDNAIKFLEGAVAGVALGVAATLFLNSNKGKEITSNIKDATADFYKSISPKLKKLGKMGEKEYKLFMKGAAENYTKTKKISGDAAKNLIKDAEQSWKHFSSHLGK